MVLDCVTYNGEEWAFDLRYNILKDKVDTFIVVEFDKTFSGKDKKPSFPTDRYPDVKYYLFTDVFYEKYRGLALASPNTKGAAHWVREFMQKECIKDALALANTQDEDICFIGDVDEIWNTMAFHIQYMQKLRLKVYTYYLNNRSTEIFWGTIKVPYWLVETNCLNDLRSNGLQKSEVDCGWHFTSMGGAEKVKEKLTDSYTQESYATPHVLEHLEYNIDNAKDFLGRDFTFVVDESEWPQYLKDNKEKYKHLMKV